MASSQTATTSCAAMLKVLADETRLAVVEQLLLGPKHVGEINERLKVEQSLLSHHLKVLRQAGMVEAQRDGKSVLYRLTPALDGARQGRALNLGCCLISFD
jgi:DNA-binding transcriptional ArsR family regulator